LINQSAQGYLYYVSLKGVTGAQATEMSVLKTEYLARKTQTSLPLMVGFGIKTPAMAAEVSRFADGVIVGAALINHMQESENPLTAAFELIHAMRQAIDEV
jgi:tryptophan synthase alpha chain